MTQYGPYEPRIFIQFWERNFPPLRWTGIQEELAWGCFVTMWSLRVSLVWKKQGREVERYWVLLEMIQYPDQAASALALDFAVIRADTFIY